MISLGVDIVEIARIKKAMEQWGERFTQRIYSPAELSLLKKLPSFAANFAAKEATIKALGKRLPWREIEVLRDSSGKPYIRLAGKNSYELEVSLAHSKEFVVAVVIKYEAGNL